MCKCLCMCRAKLLYKWSLVEWLEVCVNPAININYMTALKTRNLQRAVAQQLLSSIIISVRILMKTFYMRK